MARSYLDFGETERLVFLQILAKDFGLDKATVSRAFERLEFARPFDSSEHLFDHLHPDFIQPDFALPGGPVQDAEGGGN